MSKLLNQAVNDIARQLKNAPKGAEIHIQWSTTEVIDVVKNTPDHFSATLKDSMGVYHAEIRRQGSKVTVDFEGVGPRTLDVEFARWEFDMIWADCEAQGHKVLAIS